MVKTTYTRGELIRICEQASVPEDNWTDRDSARSQIQVGECWALLRAGCEFTILHGGDYCSTDDRTIWVEIQYRGFNDFELGGTPDQDAYYPPTAARLDARGTGKDWY